MPVSCKNCGMNFTGNYCPQCGQPASTQKITFRVVLHDLQYGIIHFNRGFFFTIKELFTRPGPTIKEYLQGKRVRHYRPISLLLILSTLYIFLFHYFKVDLVNIEDNANPENEIILEAGAWIQTNFALTELLFLPLFSLITFIILYKYGNNYFEHIVINAFIGCQSMTLKICAFPLLIFLKPSSGIYLSRAILLISILLMFWTFSGLYIGYNRFLLLLRTVVIVLLMYITSVVIILLFAGL